MTTRATLALAAVLATTAAAGQEPPRFEGGIQSVYLDVAVLQQGKPVVGMTASDFEVLDEGVRQEVTLVEGGGPAHAVLALDVSASVAGDKLAALKTAAAAFLDGLKDDDRATLVTFSHEVRVETAVAATASAARAAVEGTHAGGGTVLFDAAAISLALANRRHGRPVILLFSDGDDQLSWNGAERLRVAAREAAGVFHAVTVALQPAQARPQPGALMIDPRGEAARRQAGRTDAQLAFDTWSRAITRRAHADVVSGLSAIAEETGGRVWRADKPAGLPEAFLRVLEEVRSRYVLRFEPRGVKPGGWHRLEVHVKGRRCEVQARRGYRSS